MSSTDNNENQHLDLEKALNAKELEAIYLRFEGVPLKTIADKLNDDNYKVEYQTVRAWFMRGGRLHDYYQAYAKEEGQRRQTETWDMMKAHLPNAMRTLLNIMSNSKMDMARVAASKEVMNRILGEPIKPIDLVGDKAVEYAGALKEYRNAKDLE